MLTTEKNYKKYFGKKVEEIDTGRYVGEIVKVEGDYIFLDNNTSISIKCFKKNNIVAGNKSLYFPPKYHLLPTTKFIINDKFPWIHKVDRKSKSLEGKV